MERRLAAILSADAVGYTRLMADDPAATVRTITACRERIGRCVTRRNGRVVDDPGDNVLAEFGSATDAVAAAAAIQAELAAFNAELAAERRMPFRIGLHVGDVMAEDERIYGDGVNIAARLEALADPGGVCLSANVRSLVGESDDWEFEALGASELKNVAEPIDVFRLRLAAQGVAAGRAGDQPAIAVLPFANLSSDPEQGFLRSAELLAGIQQIALDEAQAEAFLDALRRAGFDV